MRIVRLPVLPPGVVRLAAPPGIVVEGPRHPRAAAGERSVARFAGSLTGVCDGAEVVSGQAEILVTGERLAIVVWEGHSDGGVLGEGGAMAVLELTFDDVVSASSGPRGLELRTSADDGVTVIDVRHRLDDDLTVLEPADTPLLLREIRRARAGDAPAPPPARPPAPRPAPAPPAPPAPTRGPAPPYPPRPVARAGSSFPPARPPSAIPPPVWAVIGLLCLAGGSITVPLLTTLPDLLGTTASGALGALRLLLLMFLVLALAVGAACFGLAFMLWRGDRVGRVLTVALCGAIVVGFIFGDGRSSAHVLVVLACASIIVALVASPSARAYFTGPYALERDQPSSVVAARTILVGDAAMLSVAGAMLLLAGQLGGKFVVIGLGLLGVSAGGFWANSQLRVGDLRARTIVSLLMGAYAVLLLTLGTPDAGALVPMGLALAVPVLLWLGPDARQYFGDRPIDYSPVLDMLGQVRPPGTDQAG